MSPWSSLIPVLLLAGVPAGQLSAPVVESSGFARSPLDAGIWFTHNDSGDGARIFAVTPQGALRGTFRASDVSARDWEAITTTSEYLFVGDIGNNNNKREDLAVHRLAIPRVDAAPGAPVDAVIEAKGSVRIRYADQGWPPSGAPNFDAEALFAAGDAVWILSKHRADTRTTLYRLPLSAFERAPGAVLALDPLATFDVGGADRPYGGMVTSADADPSGRRLAVLSYHALFVFSGDPMRGDWLSDVPVRLDLDQRVLGQCEAVIWDGEDIVVGNEAGALRRFEPEGRW